LIKPAAERQAAINEQHVRLRVIDSMSAITDSRPSVANRILSLTVSLLLSAVSVSAQSGTAGIYSVPTPRPINPATNTTNPSTLAGQRQNPFLGSAPVDPATGVPLSLSLSTAIERGLRYNLGVIDATTTSSAARAARLGALSSLLPTIAVRAARVYEELSLREVGLDIPGLPSSTGSFAFQDVRVFATQSIYSGELRNRYRAARAAARASDFNAKDARDVVVFAVGSAYLQIVASAARLDTATAQLASAAELDRLAHDRVTSEVAPEIDSLRAQVERQSAEQRVITARNDLEKDRATLARLIGLPVDQPIVVDREVPYRPMPDVTEATLQSASLQARSDLAAAGAEAEAAALTVRAKQAQAHPTVGLTADYGRGGDRGHFDQVYTVAAGVSVPIYTGGRIAADVAEAESELARRRAEYEDLQGRVAYDVHVAWLDLTASQSSVTVAQQNKALADRALAQAQDRYANGVTNYLEVVQSQETVARANENLIASLYAFNVAKLALARASGHAEAGAKEWFAQ
jgi:outer membrane protein TolC